MSQVRLICLIASVCFAFYTMAEQNDDKIALDNYDERLNVDKNAPSGVQIRSRSMFRKYK
jgi:hypothetical protein